MPLKNLKESFRKSYMSYKNDRVALARIVSNGRKTKSTYSEGDAIRESLLRTAGEIS